MFRKLSVFLLLGLLSWQLLLPIPVMLDYAVRYETYSEKLCENRFDPSSDCNGSCQISRILKGENQKQSEPTLPAFQMPKDWLALADSPSENLVPQRNISKKAIAILALLPYQQPFLAQGKKPPQTIIPF